MPKISIIIPVYNAESTLRQCLASIDDQTLQDFEIIAVNDGSTDKSQSILESWNRKIIILNQENQGAAVARNQGAKLASGEFLIFCDADIILKPTALEKMHQALVNNPNASYAYSAFKFGFKTFKLWPFDAEKLKQLPYIHTTSLIRKDHFPGFDEKLKRFQDWDLWLTMLKNNHPGYFIPEVLFYVRSGGTMSSWLPSFIFKLPIFQNNAKVIKYQKAKQIIAEKHNL
jgi:glycosyltransferase involved in cell wall biosynthesis